MIATVQHQFLRAYVPPGSTPAPPPISTSPLKTPKKDTPATSSTRGSQKTPNEATVEEKAHATRGKIVKMTKPDSPPKRTPIRSSFPSGKSSQNILL